MRSETSYVGKTRYAARPKGCPVEVFPSTTPTYAWEDLASVDARCHKFAGRDACVNELREEACKLGGDTLYDFTDGLDIEHHVVIATVARRKIGAPAPVTAARVSVTNNAAGQRDLKLDVQIGQVRLLLRSVPAAFSVMAVQGLLLPANNTPDCTLSFAADGQRVELLSMKHALEPTRVVLDATMSYSALENLGKAERVVGRACNEEIVFSAQDLASLKDYAFQVRETIALLPPVAPAHATAAPATATPPPAATPGAPAATTGVTP